MGEDHRRGDESDKTPDALLVLTVVLTEAHTIGLGGEKRPKNDEAPEGRRLGPGDETSAVALHILPGRTSI